MTGERALVCNGCGCGLAVSTPGNRLSTRLFQVGDTYWHEQCVPYDMRAAMHALGSPAERLSHVCECTCNFALGPCMVHTDRVTVKAGYTLGPQLSVRWRVTRLVVARILRMRVPV